MPTIPTIPTIQDISDKLQRCQRIDREFRHSHNKLLTVFEAFKRLRRTCVRLDSATQGLLQKLPTLTSDRELQEMQQTVNKISSEVAQMGEVFDDGGVASSWPLSSWRERD